ncbi:unnamed protein product [Penicillium discolor]
MSSDETPNVPAPRTSREAVREKAQKADGVVVTDIASAAIAGTASATPEPEPSEAGASETPSPEPSAAGAVEVHVYVDYLSPDAGKFERANARLLAQWIEDGAATVSYHPVALLTASSNGTKYSLRSAAAAACVATHSPDQFYAFNHDLLDDQPDEATTRALEGPLPGSDDLVLTAAPMIVVNGEAYVGALDDPQELSTFVMSVASEAYYESATPTPSPTATSAPAQ